MGRGRLGCAFAVNRVCQVTTGQPNSERPTSGLQNAEPQKGQEPAAAALPGEPPRMNSPIAAAEALRWGLVAATAGQARSITCVSTHFESWPLDDAQLLQALTAWLRGPQRRLVLLSTDFDRLNRALPRFAQWRRDWVHAVPAWRCPAELAPGLVEGLFDDRSISVQVFDAETGRGRASNQPRHAFLLAQQTDVVLQRSEAAWPLKTLGL